MKNEFCLSKPIGKSRKPNSPIVKINKINLTIEELLAEKSTSGKSCTVDGEEYSDGSYICINHVLHKCRDGKLIGINKECE